MIRSPKSESRDVQNERTTPGDLAAHVDRVCKALTEGGASDLVGLVQRLTKISETAPFMQRRVPFGLIGSPDERGRVTVKFIPFVPCILTHLVLSPETAKAYTLETFVIGQESQTIDAQPVPLDTFSIEYMADDRLALCQEWAARIVNPGIRCMLYATMDHGPMPTVPFRGVLWAKYQ